MRIQTAQQKYLNAVFGQNDSELDAIREELHRHNVERMSISGYEARMMQFFVRTFGVRKIVEVGTLFGYSALAMAKALPDDGVIYTLEKSPENHAIAQKHFTQFAAGKKVKALCGDAVELLADLKGPFDLAFIDADKSGYPTYLDWAEKNVRKGGFIVGDNTFLWGGVYDEPWEGREMSGSQVKAMKEFNKRLSDPSKYNSTLISTVEGLTIAQKLV